jgi:hypothetical protein
VEIPAKNWISKSSPLVPATYQGCLQYYCHFGEGPGIWGQGPVLDPLLAGKFQKASAFLSLHESENRLLQLLTDGP